MTQLNELRLINDSNILYLKNINRNYKRNEIIKDILSDEACFFKINKNDAYMILQDIGVLDENIDDIYQQLISFDEFYRLFKCDKISLNDEEILIKYPIYDSDDIFKNKEVSSNVNDNVNINNKELTINKETFIERIIKKIKKIFVK